MKKKYLKTFMSWNEVEDFKTGKQIRAIALCDGCDENAYFYAAINAMRDGSMGEKDNNGVYERIWWGDYVCNSDISDLRPATPKEVELYLKYCPLKDEEDFSNERFIDVIFGTDRVLVVVERKTDSWWKRLVYRFQKKLPF